MRGANDDVSSQEFSDRKYNRRAIVFLVMFVLLVCHLVADMRTRINLEDVSTSYAELHETSAYYRAEASELRSNRYYTRALWAGDDYRTVCTFMYQRSMLGLRDPDCVASLDSDVLDFWQEEWRTDIAKARDFVEFVKEAIPLLCERVRAVRPGLPPPCFLYPRDD